MNKKHIGSDFDDILKQDGLLAECEASALKRVEAWQFQREMKCRRITRAKLSFRQTHRRLKLFIGGQFRRDGHNKLAQKALTNPGQP